MESHLNQDNPTGTPKFRVKFAGGPAAGITREYDRERPVYRYGMWDYEATGKRDGDFWLYALRLKNRVGRRILAIVTAAQQGNDPRLMPKQDPDRVIKRGRNELCWCGSGRKFKRCHLSLQSN